MYKAKISGYGHYVPDKIVTNNDLEKFLETDDEWIFQRTGIRQRRISEGMNTSELAYQAALKALSQANVKPEEIDLIIVATFTPDKSSPSVASMVQKKLHNSSATAFDLNGACTGFIYALKVATSLIENKMHQKALVIGSEVISKMVNWQDRTTAILFGDGAGATVLESSDESQIMRFYTQSKPDEEESVLYVNTFGFSSHFFAGEEFDHGIHMRGQKVFKFAVSVMKNTINELLEKEQLKIDDIDYIVAHQANRRIIESVSNSLKVPLEKFLMNVEKYGNTSSASIPLMLSEAISDQRLKKGMKVILVGFGGGLTWGGALIQI